MEHDDSDWEEEESMFVVEIADVVEPDFINRPLELCKIVGIESDQPILQLDSRVFRGEYKDCIGTCVLFEDKTEGSDKAKPDLKYRYKTCKKLCMQRVFLNKKTDPSKELSDCQHTDVQEQHSEPIIVEDSNSLNSEPIIVEDSNSLSDQQNIDTSTVTPSVSDSSAVVEVTGASVSMTMDESMPSCDTNVVSSEGKDSENHDSDLINSSEKISAQIRTDLMTSDTTDVMETMNTT